MGEGMTHVMGNSGRAVRHLELRGPHPPALVCWKCGAVIHESWENPILRMLQSQGRYAGEITGGTAVCAGCGREKTLEMAARLEKAQISRYGNAVVNMPVRERHTTLGKLKRTAGNRHGLDVARDWLQHPNHDLFFFGPGGVGKSAIACAMANEFKAARPNVVVVFVRVAELLRRLRDGFDGDESKMATLASYANAWLLVLDDVGAEKGTEFARATLVDLYSTRIERGRPTIWTSNVPLGLSESEYALPESERVYPRGLDELADDRLVSRIAGHAQVVEVAGRDFRVAGWRPRVYEGGKS